MIEMARSRMSFSNRTPVPNIIINGNFDIWQRGTSFPAVISGDYSTDRFRYSKSGAMIHTLSQNTNVPTIAQSGVLSNYSLLATLTTADDSIAAGEYCRINQRIEGYNFRQIAQRNFTLSFWVYATKTGTYCISFQNSAVNRSYVAEYTISVSNTWEYKTIAVPGSPSTGTWDYTSGIGLHIYFTISAGTAFQTTANSWNPGNYLATANQVNGTATGSTSFAIAQVNLIPGSIALPISYTDFVYELARCQRYYEKSYNLTTIPGTNTNLGALWFRTSSVFIEQPIQFAVSKRANPTMTFYTPAGVIGNARDNTAGADRAVTDVGVSGETTSLVYGSVGVVDGNEHGVHWVATAEL